MRAVNLLPPEERSRVAIAPGRTGGIVYAIFGLLAGLAILAFMYGSASHQISSDKTEIVSLTARTQAAQARASALTPYTSFAALREQRERTVEELVNSRFDWASAFHELGRVLPSSVSLTSLTGQVGTSANGSASSSSSSKSSSSSSSSASSATPPGSVPTFTIAGCATSQEQVAVMLDRLRLIQGVSEVALQSSTKGGPSGASSGAASGSGGCEPANPAFNVTVTFEALPTLPTSGPTTSTVASTGGSSTSESSTGGSSTSGNSGGGSSSSGNNNSSNGPGESVDGVSSNRASSAVETAR